MKFFIYRLLIFLIFITSIICESIPLKLRKYKVCNGGRCKKIRSSSPPNVLQEMDSFLYSRWTRWTPCTSQCMTKRHRSCKFPLICGNTVIHEEAFCYHRGSYCEYIYETKKQELSTSSDDLDYLGAPDYEHQHHSNERLPQAYRHRSPEQSVNLIEGTRSSVPKAVRPPNAENEIRPFLGRSQSQSQPQRNETKPFQMTQQTFSHPVNHLNKPALGRNSLSDEDYDHLGANPTCGVAHITDRNRNGISTRILGGHESKHGRWPWQVAVLNKLNEAFCGGTLISPRWILTAAHCIRKKLQVTIGEHHLHRDDGTERHYKIEAAFIHPEFDQETVDNDIALLLLPEPVSIEAGLACLPHERQVLPPAGSLCTILGWGKQRHTHVFGTTVLHEGKVPLVSNAECRYTYGHHEITENMFCAGYRTGTVDSCAGDSGGPILCSIDNRWTVFGVTSFGDGCGRKGKYGIYAKVSNYAAWINKVMKANADGGY